MREPPAGIADADVLAAAREHWDPDADAVAHLAVGFGAHHWRSSTAGRPRLFMTLDALEPRHTAASLEAAYAGAAALAAGGLEFVLACLRSGDAYTRPFAAGALSATPWVDGTVAGGGPVTSRCQAENTAEMLARLHGAASPAGFPVWAPLVPEGFADALADETASPWESGPYAESCRGALRERLGEVARWTAAYHRLAAQADDRPWVATHGEPHTRNQLVTDRGTLLVDWESLRLAPRERDLRPLVDAGHADLARPHWPMIELFDLEWRLDEVASYARWFAAPHTGTESDRVALGGLLEELERPEWSRPE